MSARVLERTIVSGPSRFPNDADAIRANGRGAIVSVVSDVSGGTLHALADRVERLAPCHRNPHRLFEERSDIANELRMLARRMGGARG